jgi:hypothetical protein
MFLTREGASVRDIIDRTIKLEGRIDVSIEQQLGLPRILKSSSLVEPRPTSRDTNKFTVCKLSTPRTSYSSFWIIGPTVNELGFVCPVACEYSAKIAALKKYFPGSVSSNQFSIVVASQVRSTPGPPANSPSSSTFHQGRTP